MDIYSMGQFILFNPPPAKRRLGRRPKPGFYVLIGFMENKIMICPAKTGEDDLISLKMDGDYYKSFVIGLRNPNIKSTSLNFEHYIKKSLIPKI